MKPLFITGIGTDIGKTVVSAILVEKLRADYWKPIQSGDLENSDTQKVKKLITNTHSVFHTESYRLTQPFSPHKSADLDGINIDLRSIVIPETSKTLIIEGAGGLMVPLNDEEYIIDLIQQLNAEVVLVVKNYLGSINHTLLSLETLKHRNIPIKGIVYNGERDSYSEAAIQRFSNVKILGYIPFIEKLDSKTITELGAQLDI